jgi:D-arabinose 1-dehydrogenase-like Zn-dependent alcohol dehydrogenase
MRAITVEPHKPETAQLEDFGEPEVREGSVLVEAIAVGICGMAGGRIWHTSISV